MRDEVNLFGVRMLIPIKWEIKITRRKDGLCEYDYTEVIKKPDNVSYEEFRKGAERSVAIFNVGLKGKVLKYDVSLEIRDDIAIVKLRVVDTFDKIASMVVSEFLASSKLGDLRLREMLMLPLVLDALEFIMLDYGGYVKAKPKSAEH